MPKLYRKKQLTEMTRWTPGIDMEGVSINDKDKAAGSPRDGDMIACDPENPGDRWLVSAEYFRRNYEPM